MFQRPVGPSRFTVEAHQLRCSLCAHHDQLMLHSGPRPVYHHYCEHPAAREATGVPTLDLVWPDVLGATGRFIGDRDRTPEWCPVRGTQQPEGGDK